MCRFLITTDTDFDYKENDQFLINLKKILDPGGPDFQKKIDSSGIFAYHARLSIQDLSSKSNQPIENDKYLFVYNGEIFNWPELIN